MKPRSAPWRTVGSIPISVTAPTMAKALTPQSRSTSSSGVPTNIDMASLSNTASLGSGASSGTSWTSGASRRNSGRTSSTRSTRCQAMAVRSWKTPASSLGSDRCLANSTRTPARRAASTTWTTRP